MAARDSGVRLMQVTRGEALGAQIAETMVLRSLEVVRTGGYRPTPEQFAALAKALTRTALALGQVIADATDGGAPAPSDDEIDEAAEHLTHVVVCEALPAPMKH